MAINSLWNGIPSAVEPIILQHLDLVSLRTAKKVCKRWSTNENLKHAYESALRAQAIQGGYPEKLITIFESKKIYLAQLPIWRIDFSTLTFNERVSPDAMSFNIMKFNDQNKPGIALKLVSKQQPSIRGIFAFKQYHPNHWMVHIDWFSQLKNVMWEVHKPQHIVYQGYCDLCSRLNYIRESNTVDEIAGFVENILKDQDRYCGLDPS